MITRIKGIVFMIIVVLLVGIVLPIANTASVQASTAFASFDPADLGGINIGAGVINSPNAWLAQTFFCATQDHEINRVDLYLERDGNPGDVTVSIKAVDTNGHPTGPDLTSSTIAGDNIPTSTDWVQIDIAPYYLSYGNPYAVVVRATNAAESDKLFWYGDLDEGLACGAGLGSLNNGTDWQFAAIDYMFIVYGDEVTAHPDITVDPTSTDFSSVLIGSSSSTKTVTVTNDGNLDLNIGSISITGTDADQFSKQNDNCSGQTLAPASSATLEVVFSPTLTGTKSATLSIPSNDPDESTVDITLSGIGINPPPVANFSATPLNGNEPLNVAFKDLSTSNYGIISWLWNFGDGETSTLQSPSHQYAQDGVYTVSLTVSEADTDSDIETRVAYITVIDTGAKILAQQTINPDSAAVVETDDKMISIELPAGTVASDAVLTIREELPANVPAIGTGFKAGATCFNIELTEDPTPGASITITVKYSDADVEASGGDPNLLTLSRYDVAAGEWVALPTTVDTEKMTLTATTDKFSTWMVMVNESLSESAGNSSSLWIWLVSIFGGMAILSISSVIIISRRRLTKETSN